MYCPKCGDEFVGGIKTCADCQEPLVEELEKSEPKAQAQNDSEYVELVTVFVPADVGELMLAKSILEDAGIRYLAKGEKVQKWGFNVATGQVEVQVRDDDAEAARELLRDLK